MKVTVDYEEIRSAIENRIAVNLKIDDLSRVTLERIVRGKGENVYAIVDVDLDGA